MLYSQTPLIRHPWDQVTAGPQNSRMTAITPKKNIVRLFHKYISELSAVEQRLKQVIKLSLMLPNNDFIVSFNTKSKKKPAPQKYILSLMNGWICTDIYQKCAKTVWPKHSAAVDWKVEKKSVALKKLMIQTSTGLWGLPDHYARDERRWIGYDHWLVFLVGYCDRTIQAVLSVSHVLSFPMLPIHVFYRNRIFQLCIYNFNNEKIREWYDASDERVTEKLNASF